MKPLVKLPNGEYIDPENVINIYPDEEDGKDVIVLSCKEGTDFYVYLEDCEKFKNARIFTLVDEIADILNKGRA